MTVGSHDLSEGDEFNRIGNLASQDGTHRLDEAPATVLDDAADESLQEVPEEVNEDSVDALASRLKSDALATLAGIDSAKTYTMTVKSVEPSNASTVPDRVVLRDWKTESSLWVEADTLAPHLGKPVFKIN